MDDKFPSTGNVTFTKSQRLLREQAAAIADLKADLTAALQQLATSREEVLRLVGMVTFLSGRLGEELARPRGPRSTRRTVVPIPDPPPPAAAPPAGDPAKDAPRDDDGGGDAVCGEGRSR